MSDVQVTTELLVIREKLISELQAAKGDVERWAAEIRQLSVVIPVTIKDDARAPFRQLMADLQTMAAQGITIPVNINGPGGGWGGGGGNFQFNQAVAAYTQLIQQNLQQNLSLQQNNLVSNSLSNVTTNIVNNNSGGGGGGNGGLAGGLVTRLIMAELVRAPIEHVGEQYKAWSAVREGEIGGTAAQQRAALLKAIDTDSGGFIGSTVSAFTSEGYGYNPARLANDIRRGEATEESQGRLLADRQILQDILLHSDSDRATAMGDPAEGRRLRREAKYGDTVAAARAKAAKALDELNPADKRADIEREYARVSAAWAGDFHGEAAKEAKRHLLDARNQRDAMLRQLDAQRQGIVDVENASVGQADLERQAGAKEDAAKQALLDVKGQMSVAQIGRQAEDAQGGTGEQRMERFKRDLQERIDGLREVDKAQGKRMDNEADARERAMPLLIAAKQKEEEIAKANSELSRESLIGGLESGNRAAELASSGSTLAAAREKINAGFKAAQNKTLEQYNASQLTANPMNLAQLMQIQQAQMHEAAMEWDKANLTENLRSKLINDNISEIVTLDPYQRARKHIGNEAARALAALGDSPDPKRKSEIERTRDAELGTLDRLQGIHRWRGERGNQESDIANGTRGPTGTRHIGWVDNRGHIHGGFVPDTPDPEQAEARSRLSDAIAKINEADGDATEIGDIKAKLATWARGFEKQHPRLSREASDILRAEKSGNFSTVMNGAGKADSGGADKMFQAADKLDRAAEKILRADKVLVIRN